MERILLVEDEQKLAQVIARELEAEGYHVIRAATCCEMGVPQTTNRARALPPEPVYA
ncbi:MAG: hypothetical protein M8467_20340 [Anaerolineae bacterium]|nr:hypothetical protein [Anaerolineae bacterium]